jgi:hypothetical protein
VTQHIQQRFVDLRPGRLAADLIAELRFHRVERRFDIAANMVARKELSAVHRKEVEQPRPNPGCLRFCGVGIAAALEGNQRFDALSIEQFRIGEASISLVVTASSTLKCGVVSATSGASMAVSLDCQWCRRTRLGGRRIQRVGPILEGDRLERNTEFRGECALSADGRELSLPNR